MADQEMDLWDKDAIDLVERALSRSTARKVKCASSPCMPGSTFRYGARDRFPIAEFSWEGVDEGDQRSGGVGPC
jgi:hypothetical protein